MTSLKFMKVKRMLFITAIILSATFQLFAQDDTAFVYNYKRFRKLVDPLPSFAIYLVPFQSSQKLRINESKFEFKNAYHFLKNKEINIKRPQFILGVLIDDLEMDYPIAVREETTKTHEYYKVSTKYRLSFNLLVHTKTGETIKFPLTTNKEFVKEIRLGVYTSIPNNTEGNTQTSTINQEIVRNKEYLKPNMEDFKLQLRSILESYKNYYVDRIDW